MIRSMTGFGRSTFDVEGASFEVEIRTVNHRHLDVRARLPKPLRLPFLLLPAAIQSTALAALLDRALAVPLADGEFDFLFGRTVSIRIDENLYDILGPQVVVALGQRVPRGRIDGIESNEKALFTP